MPGPTQHYPPELKREVVQLYRSSGKSIPKVADVLGVDTESLRRWIKQHIRSTRTNGKVSPPTSARSYDVGSVERTRPSSRRGTSFHEKALFCQEADVAAVSGRTSRLPLRYPSIRTVRGPTLRWPSALWAPSGAKALRSKNRSLVKGAGNRTQSPQDPAFGQFMLFVAALQSLSSDLFYDSVMLLLATLMIKPRVKHVPYNIVATGGAGFIGSNLMRHLLAVDREMWVVNLDLITYAAFTSNLDALPDPSRHVLVAGDVCDRPLVDWLLREYAIDTVMTLATETHVDCSIVGPSAFVRTNAMGTFFMLEAARVHRSSGSAPGPFRFHHVSTDEVFGSLSSNDSPFTEETSYTPNSPYSASKAGSDHMARAYHGSYGLPVIITNCSNNYGTRQHSEKFIPTIIRACPLSKPVPVYGDGSNVRDWLYAKNHCWGMEAVLRLGRTGRAYNIGAGDKWSNVEIAQLICRLMDEYRPEGSPHERLITFVKDRPGHDWRYAINAGRAHKELGWRPEEPFTTGIKKTITYCLRAEQQGES